MHLVMFDIDGTLVESTAFDDVAYTNAVEQELSITLARDWETYTNVTDTGLLQEVLDRHHIQTPIDNIIEAIKNRFFKGISEHLNKHGLQEILGASACISELKKRDNLRLAIATGGWRKSAEMKLHAAGINFETIPLSTSDDHHTRIGIMNNAAKMTKHDEFTSRTYFGDAIWDKKACAELNYNFIAIGNKVEHTTRCKDFSEIDFDAFVNSL